MQLEDTTNRGNTWSTLKNKPSTFELHYVQLDSLIFLSDFKVINFLFKPILKLLRLFYVLK
jgi:hypothetical protein